MKRALLIVLAASLIVVASPFAQGEGAVDETRIALRDEFLRLINKDRTAHGLQPVKLDPEASTLADAYCREQIRNGTTGHYTIDGLSPYMRYSFAGGNDGISENAAAWSAPYKFTSAALFDMMRRSQQAMMRELPPNDGHRRAILDPAATHVGIGLAWDGGEFRLAQEFVRRYLEWSQPFPRTATIGERIVGVGRPVAGYQIEAISVHHEAIPRLISAEAANRLTTYNLPSKRRDYLPRLRTFRERRANGALYEITEQYADGSRGDIHLARDGGFNFTVPFLEGPGIYTVVVWVRKGNAAPIPASNISIRVDRGSGSGSVVGAR